MIFLPVPANILKIISDYNVTKNRMALQVLIADLDVVILFLSSNELNNKVSTLEKLSPNIILESWNLMPLDRIRGKPQRWERHYKENIMLMLLYFEQIKNILSNSANNLKQEQLNYIGESIRDTLLFYIGFKQEYEYMIHDVNYSAPAGISPMDHSAIKHMKTFSFLFRNHGYEPRELIPPTAFEIRQMIETKIYNSFGLKFVYKINGTEIENIIIPLKVVFEFLKQPEVKEKIKFVDGSNGVDYLSELEIIYKWSNSFIHTGIFPYYWQIWYALIKINPLCKGLKNTSSTTVLSTNSSVQIKRGELVNIQTLFREFLRKSRNKRRLWIFSFWQRKAINSIDCYFDKPNAIEI